MVASPHEAIVALEAVGLASDLPASDVVAGGVGEEEPHLGGNKGHIGGGKREAVAVIAYVRIW